MVDMSVAMLRCNTQGALGGGGAQDRLQEFSDAVTQSSAMMDRMGAGLRMVIAPEYFYSAVGQIGRNVLRPGPQALSRGGKHDLYDDLKRVSAAAGGTILVAGSIYYAKGNNTRGLNVCPVLRHGRIIYKYYKKFDDGILDMGVHGANYEHKNTDPVFRVKGVRFGIEICGDHTDNNNSLASWMAAHNNPVVDVHIMISYSNAPVQQNMRGRAQGYFLHCDLMGYQAAALGVYQSSPAGVFPVPGLATSMAPSITFTSGPNLSVSIFRLTGL